ncbi:hypothetical protein [Micromonospora sp. NPDC047730]|uniref:hypothetical protein n=1 Tax=Micromonospora sp. NPDC047730 TaxID=3364253 RepID=UPI00371096E3
MDDREFLFDAAVTATFAVTAPTLLDAAAKVREIQEADPDDLDDGVLLRSLSWGIQVDGELVQVIDGGMSDPVTLDRMSDPATRGEDVDPERLVAAIGEYRAALRTGRVDAEAGALRLLANLALERWPEVAERLPDGL